nr:RHS repeat-associated core domain-containing protein [Pseudoalteromonas luteoviolacea]
MYSEHYVSDHLSGLFGTTPRNLRSYTGHEPVALGDDSRILHMNGRIYDVDTGRVMQADPFVQAPSNLQNYNAYSYVLNNPLSYTDPSGYLIAFTKPFKKVLRNVIRASSKVFGPTLTNIVGNIAFYKLGGPFGSAYWSYNFTRAMGGSSSQALKAGAIAAVSAEAFNQIGRAFDGTGGAFWKTGGIGHVATHALTGGIIADLQGGKFGHGFWSAGLTKGLNINGLISAPGAGYDIARIAVAAIVGGTVSKVTGGKFSNGATTAAFAQAFNGNSQIRAEQDNNIGYPFGKESQLAMASDMNEEELALYDEAWKLAIKNRIMGKTAEQHAADNYLAENPGSHVIIGGITLRVGPNGEIRYPDLTAFKVDGNIEFIEVKAGAAKLSPRQIRLDRVIQTQGAIVSRSTSGYLPARTILGPTNVDLHRITFGNLLPKY